MADQLPEPGAEPHATEPRRRAGTAAPTARVRQRVGPPAALAGVGVGGRSQPRAGRPQVAPLPPETSSRFAQTIMLGLSVLLLGIAAVVFVGVISDLEPWSQLLILLAVVALALAAAPPVAHRGLTATAETVAVVGLLVVSIAGYALWTTGVVGALPGPVYSGLVAAGTAAVGYGYHLATRLDVPRWTALLALQPALPLIASPLVDGAVGWALVFAAVAAQNGVLAASAGDRPLGYCAWVLHGLATAVAIGYAAAGVIGAATTTAALTAGLALVAAAAVAVAGGVALRRRPWPDLAAGLLTVAVIVSVSRVLALAMPGRALLPVTLVAALTALAVTALPRPARRGPLWGVAAAFAVLGVVVAGLSLRAGVAAVVLPPWPAGLAGHREGLVGAYALTGGWQLAPTAALLTAGAAVAVPRVARVEAVVAGVALTALAAPASLSLPPTATPWLLTLATAAVAVTGLGAASRRAAGVHLAAATVVGLAAAGTALVSPALTAAILTALTLTGVTVVTLPARHRAGRPVREWGAGLATLLLPGAAGTGAVAVGAQTSGVLVAAFASLCGSVGYAAARQLRDRSVPVPTAIGSVVAAVAVVGLAMLADGVTAVDRLIAVVLLITAVLAIAAPQVDARRRPGRRLDGADLAAAALTMSVIATLARVVWLTAPVSGPDGALATAGALVCGVAIAVRAVPAQMRRGPVAGLCAVGALLALIAGAAAVTTGAQALAIAGPLWGADLPHPRPPMATVAGLTWAVPFTLGLLAVAAALAVPRPAGSRASAGLGVLATVAIPAALGAPWWAAAAVSTAAGAGYVLSAVLPVTTAGRSGSPVAVRAATARATAGAFLLLYAVGAALVRSWTTAAVLAAVAATGAAVTALAMRQAEARSAPDGTGALRLTPLARRALWVGGAAVTGVVLAVAAALTAFAHHLGRGPTLLLLAALAGASLGLASLAALPARWYRYLPYGTAGVTAAATAVALFALPTAHPAEVYAAAAVLLAVLAELLREARRPPGYRSLVRPAVGALLAAAVPSLIAVLALGPALVTALVGPYQALAAPWQGPPPELVDSGAVQPSSVVAALVLTLAAALAAVGFGGAVTRQAVPLVAPGLAVTLLLAPGALGAPWPTATAAALLVFTISVLGVALTPPPPVDATTRPLRANRAVVLGIGLAAGGAGLAGALADPQLTWVTLGGAVVVGGFAALGGQTWLARRLGWVGAVLAAEAFALVTAYLLGASRPEAAFAPLAVAAAALLVVPRLPQLRGPGRQPVTRAELAVVEWLGGYASVALALGLTLGSPPHLAAVLIGGGAVLGLAGLNPDLTHTWRRGLWWSAALSEVAAWWIIMRLNEVAVLEAYTLPFAAFALLVGALEARYRPELGSWVTWGPGLVAALGPSLVAVVTTTAPEPARQAWVLIGGVAALLTGSRLSQRAPLIIGSAVTAIAALHLLSLAGPWLVLIPLGLLLLVLGANREKRERDLARLRGAYHRMR